VHFNVANRKIHHWTSFAAAVPLLVIIASGILLQTKKQWDWVQPPEQRGTGTAPAIDFVRILETLKATPALGVSGWDDVDRLDVRPGRGVAKVTLKSRWEAQIDLGTGQLLQTAYRRSDLIESIHDGSFLAGDWTRLGLFLPAGIVLLVLWLSGLWMVWVQFAGKRRRKRMSRAASILLVAALSSGMAVAQSRLAVEPLIGHWEEVQEGSQTVVLADARKWKAGNAATPFPIAAVRGVENFTDGVLAVKFKLVAGESDQIAGLAFGIAPKGATYYYVRYNTKDGNIALWQFEGDRKRILEGTEHLQLPLNTWHDIRVEIRGTALTASINGRLHLACTLPRPVSGRVGFWTKRDSVTAFRDFSTSP
jgi:hypothetical protein